MATPFTNSPFQPISLKHVTVQRNENILIEDVNLEIQPGEMVYVTGPVGCGKSSLLELIYGELPLYEGEGSVLGFNLKKLKIRKRQALRREMGIVFQSQAQLLYDRNIEKNLDFVLRAIRYGNRRERKLLVENVLGKVGMSGKGYRMPHELSGGEAERICIARALIVNPKLIVLDEPTSGLDASTAYAIGQLIKDISESGTAVIMSTHNEELIRSIPARTLVIDPTQRRLTEAESSVEPDAGYEEENILEEEE